MGGRGARASCIIAAHSLDRLFPLVAARRLRTQHGTIRLGFQHVLSDRSRLLQRRRKRGVGVLQNSWMHSVPSIHRRLFENSGGDHNETCAVNNSSIKDHHKSVNNQHRRKDDRDHRHDIKPKSDDAFADTGSSTDDINITRVSNGFIANDDCYITPSNRHDRRATGAADNSVRRLDKRRRRDYGVAQRRRRDCGVA